MQGRGGEKRKGYAKIPPNSGHSFHSIIGTCLAVLFVGSFFGLLAFCCGRWRSFDLLLCLFCCGQLKHYRLLALFRGTADVASCCWLIFTRCVAMAAKNAGENGIPPAQALVTVLR